MRLVSIFILVACIVFTIWSTFVTKANNLIYILIKQAKRTHRGIIHMKLNSQENYMQLNSTKVDQHILYTTYNMTWGSYDIVFLQIRFTKPRNISIYENGDYICSYKDLPIYYRVHLYYNFLKKFQPVRAKWYAWIMKLNFDDQGTTWYRTHASQRIHQFLINLLVK